jgi:hypothetical protein
VNVIQGLWPGAVDSYDKASRTCRVSVPSLTQGSDILLNAVFNNPLGDDPGQTEIRILPGALVWLMFEQGDPRFPIIMGYRTPRAGNPVDWRRWHHKNIQLTAENQFVITLGGTTITVTDGLINITGADMHLDGNLLVAQNLMVAMGISAGTNIVATGSIADQGGTKSMGAMRTAHNTHTHSDPQGGAVGLPSVLM